MLNHPSGRLDLDHVDVNDALVEIVHRLSLFVESAAFRALGPPVAGVEPAGQGIQRSAVQEVWIGLDRGVDTSLVPVHMHLMISAPSTADRTEAYRLVEKSGNLFDHILPAKTPDVQKECGIWGVEAHLLKEILQDGLLSQPLERPVRSE